jgi:hypothetical protein
MLPEHRDNIHPAPSLLPVSVLEERGTRVAALRRGIAVVLDRAARGENVVAALAGLVR